MHKWFPTLLMYLIIEALFIILKTSHFSSTIKLRRNSFTEFLDSLKENKT